ncbi:MAG: sigma-70 family RNA polymerase sigma factor [Pseudomonadota bacterium]
MQAELGPILKAAYPQVVATLTRVLGDMDRAMDATQDALVKALQTWQVEGVPSQPVAWLVTVGRNRAIDVLRRDAKSASWETITGDADNVVHLADEHPAERWSSNLDVAEINLSELEDDMLRLIFTCCNPLLTPPMQITLVLKVVLGFNTNEIARTLLTSPATVEKRITRAKQRLKDAEVEYVVPRGEELPERLQAVLRAIYLLFNEGYTRILDGNLMRGTAMAEAIRLGRMTSRLFRHNPEPRSLLALMLLNNARLPGRLDAQGHFVPLHAQDRARWDQAMIREGVALIDAVYAARHPPGAYQIQAAISAIHSQAATAEDTDWPQIVALYGKLAEYDASPVVPVNQAAAMCFVGQTHQAVELLETLAEAPQLRDYQPYHAACGYAYALVGSRDKARAAYHLAIELANSPPQKAYLQARLKDLVDDPAHESGR